eukprot:768691-Hanusia_phi.AAC.3
MPGAASATVAAGSVHWSLPAVTGGRRVSIAERRREDAGEKMQERRCRREEEGRKSEGAIRSDRRKTEVSQKNCNKDMSVNTRLVRASKEKKSGKEAERAGGMRGNGRK